MVPIHFMTERRRNVLDDSKWPLLTWSIGMSHQSKTFTGGSKPPHREIEPLLAHDWLRMNKTYFMQGIQTAS